jgi:hypothetical protein
MVCACTVAADTNADPATMDAMNVDRNISLPPTNA